MTSTMTSLASRFRGCLLGSHVGDCLAAPFEGDLTVAKSLAARYISSLLSDSIKMQSVSDDYVNAAKYIACQDHPYTDDTALTVCVAKSLAKLRRFDSTDMAKRLACEYFRNRKRGYGLNVGEVFFQLKDNDFTDIYGPARTQFSGAGSYGNGGAMRTAPIALYCYKSEIDTVKQIAKDCALITHAHQHGYNGAVLQCLAVHEALKASNLSVLDPVEYVDHLMKHMDTIEEEFADATALEKKRPFCDALKWIKEKFEQDQFSTLTAPEVARELGHAVAAHRSVPSAIFAFLRSLYPMEDFVTDNPYVRAIYFAICMGGDTDTIAAMAGSISGAYHGEEVIPKGFIERCESIEISVQAADNLYEACTGD